jgi:phosphomannomutase
VITASHNPAAYSGLKIKGAFGGSVAPEVTQQVEALLAAPLAPIGASGTLEWFDPWPGYCAALQAAVDVERIRSAIASGQLTVFADVMHGAATGGLTKLLGEGMVHELNGSADPLFGGGAPEPLPKYIGELMQTVKTYQPAQVDGIKVGLVFDGDSDRIAAVDHQGEFRSSQVLIPILIEHLQSRRQFSGEVVKTISGSNLIADVAKLYNLPLHETAIGYKYIADRMQEAAVLLGGEESGGIGYGHHIPERDALLSALYVLEAVVMAGQDIAALYDTLQARCGFSAAYDRIDLPLASMEVRAKLQAQLDTQPPTTVAGKTVTNILAIDGYKFTLADNSWLLIRFSGTEPILRIYSEGPTLDAVHQHLHWAKDWATAIQ